SDHFKTSHKQSMAQKKPTPKPTPEEENRLKAGFPALEQQMELERGSLSFTGKTKGTAVKRKYELAIAGQTTADGKPKTIWVGVNKDGTLYLVEEKNPKAKAGGGTTEQPNFGIKHKNQP
ncbi:MAG: hemagglutinin, partial [Segatella salivae]